MWGRKKRIYLMDENVKMSIIDIDKLTECIIINSTDRFPQGTPDEVLTKASRENNWVIVTKDTRMALLSVIHKVPVIYINDDFKIISYIETKKTNIHEHKEIHGYICERFEYENM